MSRHVNRLRDLLENNRRWAERMEAGAPGFFEGLSAQQAPRYLWIDCSDSRAAESAPLLKYILAIGFTYASCPDGTVAPSPGWPWVA